MISHEVFCESSNNKSHNDSQDLLYIIPFQPTVVFHIETSHLFCSAKYMTDFYVKRSNGLKWINGSWDNACWILLCIPGYLLRIVVKNKCSVVLVKLPKIYDLTILRK